MALSSELREALARSRRRPRARELVTDRPALVEPDDDPDPDDSGPRLSVRVAEPNVEKIYPLLALLAPLPSEMPSSWWTPLLFGEAGDAISPEDAHLCLALIEARLAEGRDSGRPTGLRQAKSRNRS